MPLLCFIADEISKCNYGDSKCISEIINDIFANKFEGKAV
jgi:hypothetical protein